MNEPLASVQLDSSVVRSIVDSKIQSAIVAEFSKTPAMIEALVNHVCNGKVSESGAISGYSYENKYPMIEVLSKLAIKAEIESAIKEWVTTHSKEIRAKVQKQLDAKKLQSKFLDAIESSLTAGFYASCSIVIKPKE